jgi:hypothetical protein
MVSGFFMRMWLVVQCHDDVERNLFGSRRSCRAGQKMTGSTVEPFFTSDSWDRNLIAVQFARGSVHTLAGTRKRIASDRRSFFGILLSL